MVRNQATARGVFVGRALCDRDEIYCKRGCATRGVPRYQSEEGRSKLRATDDLIDHNEARNATRRPNVELGEQLGIFDLRLPSCAASRERGG